MTHRFRSFPIALTGALLALAAAAPAARAADTLPPTDDTVLPAPDGLNSWYVTGPVSVTLSATDDTDPAPQFDYTLDAGAPQVGAAGTVVDVTGDGVHDLTHSARDATGNATSPVIDQIKLDATAPTDTTTPPAPNANGWYQATSVTVTLTADDATSGPDAFEYRIDGGAAQPAAVGGDVTITGDGSHTLQHRARDAAGNWSAWASTPLKLDTVPPGNLTPAVDSSWRKTDLSVTVAGIDATSGVDHVEYRIGGGTVVTGSPTATATVTGDGSHALETRVVDKAGNASDWRTDTVRIDTVSPDDTTSVSSGWQSGVYVATVSGTDALSGMGHVEWQLDGGTVQTATGASAPVTVSSEGEHTLRTRVVDAAGNASQWTDRSVRIDTTAPDNVTPLPPSAWRANDYAVTVAAADGLSGVDHVEYRIDGGAARSVPPGTTVSVTGPGMHQLETRAVDRANNATAWRKDDVNIDAVAPSDTTAAGPSGAVPNPYTLTISGTDADSGVDHVEWQVDDAGIQTGASGSVVTVRGNGPHTIRERVVDRVGRDSGWRTVSVTIDTSLNSDTTPPTDSTTAAPTGWNLGPVTVTVQGSDGGSGLQRMEWRLDGQPIQAGDSGHILTVSGDGVHQLETRAVDWADQTSTWKSQTIKIDTTVPADVTPASSVWRASRSIDVKGTDAGSGVDHVEWQLDAGSVQSGPSGSTVTAPSDGDHTLRHRVIDVAGQASQWAISTLHIDTVKPVDTTPALPTGWRGTAVEQALSGTDDRSGLDRMEWTLDGGAVQSGPVRVVTDGVHTVRTRAVDAAGNDSGWHASTVEVDVTAPGNTTPAAPGGWLRAPYGVTVSADDGDGSGIAKVQWRIGDGGPVSEDPHAVVGTDGTSLLETRAVDAVGHASPWRTEAVHIDRGAPALSLDCGTDAWRTTPAACVASADGGPSGLASLVLTRDGAAPLGVASGGGITVGADGVWTVAATAVDGAGNGSGASRVVRVDRTPPAANLSCKPSGATHYRCVASGADATSGVAAVAWRVGGGRWRNPGPDGRFTIRYGRVQARVSDHAGLSTVSAVVSLDRRLRTRTRSRSVPVSLRHSKGLRGLLGALEVQVVRDSRNRAVALADVRPLAVGRGRYRTTVRISSGGLRAQRRKTAKVKRGGRTPRLTLALSRVRRPASVRLSVKCRRGHHWRTVATAHVTVKRPKRPKAH